MPWKIVRNHARCPTSKPWAVVKQAGGDLEGCHRTRRGAVKQLAALNAAEVNAMGAQEATWSTAKINDLPDISFAVIGPGGRKDSEGKTVPRSLRHLPHHGGISSHAQTNVDQPHLKNAAARANQIPAALQGKAKSHLRSHYRALGWDIPDNLKESTMRQQLVETCSTHVEILEQDTDDNAIGRARFKVSEIDQRNRNGRVYPVTVWEANVRRFTKGSVTGQDTHPGGLFFGGGVPKVTDAFLVFDQLEIVGHSVFGEALIADTQQARDFIAVAKAGAKIAVSTRGFGKVNDVEKWRDGKPAMVVQDDYQLVGIDVLLDGYQSVPTAKMKHLKSDEQAPLAYFVHEDWSEIEMNPEDITVEWLQEQLPDVYEEVRHDLEHQVADLQGQVASLTEENGVSQAEVERLTTEFDQARTEVAASQAQVDNLSSDVTVLKEQIAALQEQVITLTGERDVAQALAEARRLIFEKAQGERAAMLIIRDLLAETQTPDDVKKAFARVKREAEVVLGSLPAGEPRTRHISTEQDKSPLAGQGDRVTQSLKRQFGGGI